MARTRVLIVNDAVVIRRLVSGIVADDPALEVAGTAANGRIALAKINQLRPDLILLDVEMPEMDGMETLSALQKNHPQIPVIMLSRFTCKGAPATLDALSRGARDYVSIPDRVANQENLADELRIRLLAKIVLHTTRPAPAGADETLNDSATEKTVRIATVTMARCVESPIEVVVIGSSTGGPTALAKVLHALPADFPVPVVIVQHMPPLFTPLLARRLATKCALGVAEAAVGDMVVPGKVWLAPGNHHLAMERDGGHSVRLRTHQNAPENSCRPSVDVLFRSAAEVFGAGVLAVVLTGMGQDGLRGSEKVHAKGGQILVQDEATSIVWGMPGYVARAGLADQILPLDAIGTELIRRVRASRMAAKSPQRRT